MAKWKVVKRPKPYLLHEDLSDMTKTFTVSPAYGRDYRTFQEALNDWAAGKDFRMEASPRGPESCYCSTRDIPPGARIEFRFNRLANFHVHVQGVL